MNGAVVWSLFITQLVLAATTVTSRIELDEVRMELERLKDDMTQLQVDVYDTEH